MIFFDYGNGSSSTVEELNLTKRMEAGALYNPCVLLIAGTDRDRKEDLQALQHT